MINKWHVIFLKMDIRKMDKKRNVNSKNEPLWTQDEVLQAVQGGSSGPYWDAYGASIDSRDVHPGDLFIAIRGEVVDGHLFAHKALMQGATAAIVDYWPENLLPISHNKSVILVQNTFQALWDLAHFARNRLQAKIVAITGSVGKTTTKSALAHILSRQGLTSASEKSLNTKLGVPLSLVRASKKSKFGIFEVGMSQKNEIAPLSKLISPHVAIITMIAPAHLASMKSLEAIADEKCQITAGLGRDGCVILNHDMPCFDYVSKQISHQILTYGRHEDADLRLLEIHPLDFGKFHVQVKFKSDKTPLAFSLNGMGIHLAYNVLAALLATRELGGDVLLGAESIESFEPEFRRGQSQIISLKGGRHIVLLDETYNANPTSMLAALESLANIRHWKKGRTLAVLGDMLELGEQSPILHKNLAEDIKRLGIDAVFTCGPMMKNLADSLDPSIHKGHVKSSQELLTLVKEYLSDDDIVMAKASRGMRMDLFVESLKES